MEELLLLNEKVAAGPTPGYAYGPFALEGGAHSINYLIKRGPFGFAISVKKTSQAITGKEYY